MGQQEQVAEKGARSLRSLRELLRCGSHGQGDGESDGGQ